MTTIAYPLRIPAELVEVARLRASEEYVDQSTSLRQMLRMGAEDYVLELLAKGRVSIGRAAELLATSVYDVMRLAREKNVELGAAMPQEAAAAKTAEKLFKRKSRR